MKRLLLIGLSVLLVLTFAVFPATADVVPSCLTEAQILVWGKADGLSVGENVEAWRTGLIRNGVFESLEPFRVDIPYNDSAGVFFWGVERDGEYFGNAYVLSLKIDWCNGQDLLLGLVWLPIGTINVIELRHENQVLGKIHWSGAQLFRVDLSENCQLTTAPWEINPRRQVKASKAWSYNWVGLVPGSTEIRVHPSLSPAVLEFAPPARTIVAAEITLYVIQPPPHQIEVGIGNSWVKVGPETKSITVSLADLSQVKGKAKVEIEVFARGTNVGMAFAGTDVRGKEPTLTVITID